MSSTAICCGCHNFSSLSLNSVSDVDIESVCDACYRLHTVSKEIAELESTDQEARIRLENRRRDLATSVNDRHDSLTTKLPLEICTMIFEFVTADKSEKRTGVSSLGRVCRKWRNITITTAALWMTMEFILYLNKPAEEGNVIIAEALKRSRDSALTITLLAHVEDEDNLPENVGEIMESFQVILTTLCSASSRIKWLKFQGPDEFRSFIANNQNTPMLERLSLRGVDWARRSSSFPVEGKTWNTAALVYYGASRVYNIINEPILWENLTKLNSCYGTIIEYAKVLRMAPNLIYLSMVEQSGRGLLPSLWRRPGTPFIHENLQELFIQLEEDQDAEDTQVTAGVLEKFLSSVTLPSLTQLAVDMVPMFDEDPSNGLIGFLERSNLRQLTDFSLAFSGKSREFDLERVLRLVPTVEEFHFIEDSPDAFCQLLDILASTMQISLNDDGEPVCGSCLPRVKSVNIGLHFESWIPNEEIIPDVFPQNDDPGVPNARYRPLSELCIRRMNTDSKLLMKLPTVRRWVENRRRGFYFEVVSQAGEDAEEFEHLSLSWDWYHKHTCKCGNYHGEKPEWAN